MDVYMFMCMGEMGGCKIEYYEGWDPSEKSIFSHCNK